MLAPNESYSVSSLAALRELSHLKINVTKAQGEVLLSTFVAKGWLKKSKYVSIQHSNSLFRYSDIFLIGEVVTLSPSVLPLNSKNISSRVTPTRSSNAPFAQR